MTEPIFSLFKESSTILYDGTIALKGITVAVVRFTIKSKYEQKHDCIHKYICRFRTRILEMLKDES